MAARNVMHCFKAYSALYQARALSHKHLPGCVLFIISAFTSFLLTAASPVSIFTFTASSDDYLKKKNMPGANQSFFN